MNILPAGDMQRLAFACAYGTDAVYAEVPRYSLRTQENGFVKAEDIRQAIEWMSPDGSISAPIEVILSKKYESPNKISGGVIGGLPAPRSTDQFTIIRKSIENNFNISDSSNINDLSVRETL